MKKNCNPKIRQKCEKIAIDELILIPHRTRFKHKTNTHVNLSQI